MTIEVKHTTQATGTDAGNGEIAKAQWNEAHTLNMASGNLLGRSTSGAGVVEEIAIGSGLSLSGGTLSASGGGGGSSTLTIQNKTAAYTVVAGDNGTIINCTSGTFTVSLTAAATLGAGFNCWVWNTGTQALGYITIDPNGTETIDGVATLILRQGEGAQVVCNGTKWHTGGKKVMRGYADNIYEGSTRPVASGGETVAIGTSATSSESYAIAIGSGVTTTASALGALAIYGQAASRYSSAIGQNSSNAGSQTATGYGAMALGGSYASGTDSFAAAITNNASGYGATWENAVAIGQFAKGSGSKALGMGGWFAIASAPFSVVVGGNQNTAGSQYSAVLGGYGGRPNSVGKVLFPGALPESYGTGAAAFGLLNIGKPTTNATATVLTANASSATDGNQVILPNNSAYAFTGIVVARQSAAGGTASAAWKVEGLIRREGSAGTTTLVASTVTAISNVPGWTLALSADTTNGGLAVTATGAAATNIRWVATIQTSEVTYA